MSSADLVIGGEYLVRIVEACGDRRWDIHCEALPPGWNGVLWGRSEAPPEIGVEFKAWLFSTDSASSIALFSTSDFGRLPISDRMRQRYIEALDHMIRLLDPGTLAARPERQLVSELKGMFNRCLRNDQLDWLTVYRAFGAPPKSVMRKIASELTGLSRACRDENQEETERYLAQLRDLECLPMLLRAKRHMESGS